MLAPGLNKLASGVYWMPPDHATDRPVLGAVVGDRYTLMFDAGNSSAHARLFLDALAAVGASPVRHLALSHAHWDHVFGAVDVDADAIATEGTRQQLATMATYAWSDAALDERVADGREIPFCRDMIKAELSPGQRASLELRVPETVFASEMEIDLGDRSVRLVQVGGDHARDSCILVVPGIAAFLSDCIYANLHVEPNALTRRRLFPLLDRLLTLDVEHYLLGHDDAPMSRATFARRASVLRSVGTAVQRHRRDDTAIAQALCSAAIEPRSPTVMDDVRAFQAGLDDEVE